MCHQKKMIIPSLSSLFFEGHSSDIGANEPSYKLGTRSLDKLNDLHLKHIFRILSPAAQTKCTVLVIHIVTFRNVFISWQFVKKCHESWGFLKWFKTMLSQCKYHVYIGSQAQELCFKMLKYVQKQL